MKIALRNEFLIIGGISLLLATAVAMGLNGPVRVVLGLPFVLFFPGYTLIAALFPKKDDLDGIERVALSFGLSIAVVPLIGLILNYTPWGIRLAPIMIALLFFVSVMSVLALYRRKKLPPEETFQIEIKTESVKWKELTRLDKVLSVLLIGAILFAVGSIYYVVTTPKVGEKFTEFYILGPGGKAEGYPREMRQGEEKEVILGIVNHEHSPVTYRVEVRAAGEVIQIHGPYPLNHEEKREEHLRFRIGGTGGPGDSRWLSPSVSEEVYQDGNNPVKVEFILFREGDSDPYRSLHLWVHIIE